ncbi:MAG: CRP-like cAMP-binding protein [Verrucomicrobiales bacterium]|jgi:CRP-like cAMP-binding protein
MAKETDKQLADALKRVPLFSATSLKQRLVLANLGQVIKWADGKEGVVAGSKGAAFYLILEGGVEVEQDGSVVARLRENDFFGEMALLTGKKRNASVTATSDARLFALSRPAFAGMIKKNPEISLSVLEAMALRQSSM